MRRIATWIPTCLCAWALATPATAGAQDAHTQIRPLIGAIRWDAWYGGNGQIEHAVERTLGPQRYHDRLPFFARVLGDNEVQIRVDGPAVMEWEIAFAKQARLDYWAFVWYDPEQPMSLALRYYLASPHARDIRFTLVTAADRWGSPREFPTRLGWLIDLVSRPTYQTVLDGRPLIYLSFLDDDQLRARWGSRAAFRGAIDAFRRGVIQSGRKNPYIVCMDFSAKKAAEWARSLGLDAISAYSRPGGTVAGSPFAESCRNTRAFWEACRSTGLKQVPLVSFGWDPRPRVEHPVPWGKPVQPNHYLTPDPCQAAEHLREAIDWTAAHRVTAEANAVLIYAWNENDEGGWLVPTLGPDGRANSERIRAVGQMLDDWEARHRAPFAKSPY